MLRRHFVRTISACSLIALPGSTALFAQNWAYLGEANLDGGADHDRIHVGETHGEFRRIQLLVQNAAVDFDRVEVHFGNGQTFPVALAARIPPGGKTRQIDLPGEKRWIESVEMWYHRGGWGNGAKPRVRLMGIRW
jgi:hypothetical protein